MLAGITHVLSYCGAIEITHYFGIPLILYTSMIYNIPLAYYNNHALLTNIYHCLSPLYVRSITIISLNL